MNLFGTKRLHQFDVTLHLDGRHPYLVETYLDHQSLDVTVRISAKDWNAAERAALCVQDLPKWWKKWVKAISRVEGHTP